MKLDIDETIKHFASTCGTSRKIVTKNGGYNKFYVTRFSLRNTPTYIMVSLEKTTTDAFYNILSTTKNKPNYSSDTRSFDHSYLCNQQTCCVEYLILITRIQIITKQNYCNYNVKSSGITFKLIKKIPL